MTFDLVGIGGANLDLSHRSFAPHIPRDSNPGVFKLSAGGVMRNICENAARLGVSTALVAAIGEDWAANVIRQSCLESGVSTEGLICKETGSSMYVSLLDERGDMALACSDMRIAAEITKEDLLARRELFAQAKVVCIDGNLTQEAIAYAAFLCRELGVPVFFDPVSTSHAQKFKDILPLFHTAKPNLLELSTLTDISVTDGQSLRRAVEKLLAAGLRRVFVTMGEKGACCFTREGKEYCREPWRRGMVNATGGGDAFTGALLYSYINGLSDEETLAFAVSAGEAAVRSAETVNPQMSVQLINELRKGEL